MNSDQSDLGPYCLQNEEKREQTTKGTTGGENG